MSESQKKGVIGTPNPFMKDGPEGANFSPITQAAYERERQARQEAEQRAEDAEAERDLYERDRNEAEQRASLAEDRLKELDGECQSLQQRAERAEASFVMARNVIEDYVQAAHETGSRVDSPVDPDGDLLDKMHQVLDSDHPGQSLLDERDRWKNLAQRATEINKQAHDLLDEHKAGMNSDGAHPQLVGRLELLIAERDRLRRERDAFWREMNRLSGFLSGIADDRDAALARERKLRSIADDMRRVAYHQNLYEKKPWWNWAKLCADAQEALANSPQEGDAPGDECSSAPDIDRLANQCGLKNWDSYGADPITDQALQAARAMAPHLKGWSATGTPDGGVGFTFNDMEIEVRPDGQVSEVIDLRDDECKPERSEGGSEQGGA